MRFGHLFPNLETTLNVDLEDDLLPEKELTGLDGIDSWALGYLREDAFHAFVRETRSHAKPGLTGVLEIPVYDGSLMMRVTDILGRNFYYHVNVPCAE